MPSREIEDPMAIIILSGLLTSAVLNPLVLPHAFAELRALCGNRRFSGQGMSFGPMCAREWVR